MKERHFKAISRHKQFIETNKRITFFSFSFIDLNLKLSQFYKPLATLLSTLTFIISDLIKFVISIEFKLFEPYLQKRFKNKLKATVTVTVIILVISVLLSYL